MRLLLYVVDQFCRRPFEPPRAAFCADASSCVPRTYGARGFLATRAALSAKTLEFGCDTACLPRATSSSASAAPCIVLLSAISSSLQANRLVTPGSLPDSLLPIPPDDQFSRRLR